MKISILINALVGSRRRSEVVAALRSSLVGHELDIRLTGHPGHATDLARTAVAEGAGKVVVVGGDGTVSEAANGMIGSDVPLGIIPAGRANDLAGHLGIPVAIKEACLLISAGHERRIDALRINGHYVLTTAGFGIGVEAIRWTARLHPIRAGSASPAWMPAGQEYRLGYALAVAARKEWPRRLSVRQNGLTFASTVLSLTISNLPRLGSAFVPAPDSRCDDGLADVCAIEDRGRWGAVRAAWRAAAGLTSEMPGVRIWRADRLTIDSNRPIPYFADGETAAPTTRFDVDVVAGAVRVIAPPDEGGA